MVVAPTMRTIRQSAVFGASPGEVYSLLTESKKHSEFTGAAAKVSPKKDGSFSVWDGWAFGRNVELVPGRKIVQNWGCLEDGWPEGHLSRVTFSLSPAARGKKTKLSFVQERVPAACFGSISRGWKDNYWALTKKHLEGTGK